MTNAGHQPHPTAQQRWPPKCTNASRNTWYKDLKISNKILRKRKHNTVLNFHYLEPSLNYSSINIKVCRGREVIHSPCWCQHLQSTSDSILETTDEITDPRYSVKAHYRPVTIKSSHASFWACWYVNTQAANSTVDTNSEAFGKRQPIAHLQAAGNRI